MRESQIERDVCLWARAQGILAVKFTPMGEVGWPDRIFLFRGRVMFIEFKATGKKLRPLQEHRIEQLKLQGIKAEYHDNMETAIAALQSTFFPSGWNSLGDQPSVRGLPPGSGAGEDDDHVQHIHDSTAGEYGAEDASYLPPEAVVQCLATTEGYMG